MTHHATFHQTPWLIGILREAEGVAVGDAARRDVGGADAVGGDGGCEDA